MAKRILHVIPTLDQAGAEKQLCLLARGLYRRGFDVHVCALTRSGPRAGELLEAGIPMTVIGKRWKLDPQTFWRLKQLVRTLNPDVIHTWMLAANAYGILAGAACGVRGLVASQRCVDPWKNGVQLAVDRYIAGKSDRVAVNSDGVRQFYVHHGLPAEKIEVIPNAVAPAEPSPVARKQLLEELSLPTGSRLIGLVGRLWPQKRVKDAIWAADLLKVIRDDVHLLIIGDGPLRDRLLRFRDQVCIGDKVHFLGQRTDVARLMPHFDLLFSTSEYEGQSNAILEAMAAAVPVVATDIPGTRDLVVDGITGYLVPPGDRAAFARQGAAFARCAVRLLDDAGLSRQMGAAGCERAAREFGVERMVDRYAALYDSVLDHKGLPHSSPEPAPAEHRMTAPA